MGIGVRSLAAALCLLPLVGCASLTRQDAVPAAVQERATVLGLSGVRYWADRDPSDFLADATAAYERELAGWRAAGHAGLLPPAGEPFDTAYMRQLFQVGYGMAAQGYPWAKAPPGWTAPEIEPPLAPPQENASRTAMRPALLELPGNHGSFEQGGARRPHPPA
jgi:hypothetical protein